MKLALDGGARTALTRADGGFAFDDVLPGVYLLEAHAVGYTFPQLRVEVTPSSADGVVRWATAATKVRARAHTHTHATSSHTHTHTHIHTHTHTVSHTHTHTQTRAHAPGRLGPAQRGACAARRPRLRRG